MWELLFPRGYLTDGEERLYGTFRAEVKEQLEAALLQPYVYPDCNHTYPTCNPFSLPQAALLREPERCMKLQDAPPGYIGLQPGRVRVTVWIHRVAAWAHAG